ncbi:MAG: hypothetical protein E7216_04905 [Clostridium thermopalmarium]|uniref:helix-turn-helix domain-containing protein n=1 Tax=Clostridium thermopalmarium TaxID=29373 RepID=UPI0023562D9B|nr:helix-turn-helix domain-containing protein [Clostridium thermopalmarium]MBE6043559.1 hypothetical protein [Clostridium thermopalmarium]
MRKLQYSKYIDEYRRNGEYLRNLIKKLYKPLLKSYCENNGVKYMGVADNYVHMVEKSLKEQGKATIGEVTLIADVETVLVTKTYPEYEYEEVKDLPEYADYKFIYDENENVYIAEYEDTLMTVSYSSDNALYEVYTATEAAELWGLNESTVRKAISNIKSKFTPGIDYRKAGSVTLIAKKAMERVYGKKAVD